MIVRFEDLSVAASVPEHETFLIIDDATEAQIRDLVAALERLPRKERPRSQPSQGLYRIGFYPSLYCRAALGDGADFVVWLRGQVIRRTALRAAHPDYALLQAGLPDLVRRLAAREVALFAAVQELYPGDDERAIQSRIDAFFPER